MIILTLVSMFGVGARMQVLKKEMVMIDEVPQDDARRVEFNRLHVWSTRLEGAVLIWGWHCCFSPRGGYHREAVGCQLSVETYKPSATTTTARKSSLQF